jgi:hypothetical protein
MRLVKVLITGLIISLTSCSSNQQSLQNLSSENVTQSSIPAPDIGLNPNKTFFPLRLDLSDNQYKPSFQSEICIKKFIGICTKWQKRTLFFSELEWFYINNFGLCKLPEVK